MADLNENPDVEARKWFTIAVIGALLYAGTVFAFVVTRDPGPSASPAPVKEVQTHGQSH